MLAWFISLIFFGYAIVAIFQGNWINAILDIVIAMIFYIAFIHKKSKEEDSKFEKNKRLFKGIFIMFFGLFYIGYGVVSISQGEWMAGIGQMVFGALVTFAGFMML